MLFRSTQQLIKDYKVSADKFDISANEYETMAALLNKNIGLAQAAKVPTTAGATGELSKDLSTVESRQPKNVHININNLVNELVVQSQNLTEGTAKIRDEVIRVLLSAVNDINLVGG